MQACRTLWDELITWNGGKHIFAYKWDRRLGQRTGTPAEHRHVGIQLRLHGLWNGQDENSFCGITIKYIRFARSGRTDTFFPASEDVHVFSICGQNVRIYCPRRDMDMAK